jgi:hypothetical protein
MHNQDSPAQQQEAEITIHRSIPKKSTQSIAPTTMPPSSTTPLSPTAKKTNPRPNQKIEHVTIIDAPLTTVWKTLLDVNDWRWNKWTRLEAGVPAVGLKGTLRACYEGDDKDWQTFTFEFAEVDSDSHILAWKGSLAGGCLFSGYHTMKLEEVSENKTTRLIHTEVFGGLLPALWLGLPYVKIDRNYRLMNEALKEHVERSA